MLLLASWLFSCLTFTFMLHFGCWHWALYTKRKIAQIFYIPISSRLMLLHTHLSSPGRSSLCWTWTAKREMRSQICSWSDGWWPNPAAGSNTTACPEQVLVPKCHQNNTHKTNCCPFCGPHVPNSFLLCLLFILICRKSWHKGSHPPPESLADACDPWESLGLAWAIAPDYRAEGQTANFCQSSQWDLPQLCLLCSDAEVFFV